MFELSEQPAKLARMTTFAEKHGDDHVNGIALKLETTVARKKLDLFAQGLAAMLYHGDGLRYPPLGPLSWDRELVGARVVIDDEDLLGERKVECSDAVVDKFVLSPAEGGSIAVSMRIKIKPTSSQVATLYELEHGDVTLTIDPASASEESRDPDLVDEAES